jgi:hypothetical protein
MLKVLCLLGLAAPALAFVAPAHLPASRFAPSPSRAAVPPSMLFGGRGKTFFVRSVTSRMPQVPTPPPTPLPSVRSVTSRLPHVPTPLPTPLPTP